MSIDLDKMKAIEMDMSRIEKQYRKVYIIKLREQSAL